MDAIQAASIIENTIQKELYHPDYEHVKALAYKYRQLITGKDHESLLKRFNPREDAEMFEQRKKLTIAITPAVAGNIMKVFNRVPRIPPLTAKVKSLAKEAEAAVQEVEDRMNSFYGSDNNVGGLDYFLQNRFTELTAVDPNAWIVIEFDPFDSTIEKARPRPFEVPCDQAIHFEIQNNETRWLIVRLPIEMVDPDNPEKVVDGYRYTIYTPDFSLVYEQTLLTQGTVQLGNDIEIGWAEITDKRFLVTLYINEIGQLPAFRVGYKRDIETDGRTFVNPFHDAMCHFDKSIKQVSEYDLSTCLHTFPQKVVRLTKACPGADGQKCIHGTLAVTGTICGTCRGTGRPIHTSGQDVIEVELPESKEDLIPLTDYIHYVPLPIELLKLQKEWVDDLELKCHKAVFNSAALVKQNQTQPGGTPEKTAFEVDTDMESIYDTLAPFGEKVSAVWTTIVNLIIILTDNKDKVSCLHRMPSNFKLKTKTILYAEYATLQQTQAPSFLKESVTNELAELIYMDDADELLKYRVKKIHFPFKGKSAAEIITLMNSADVLKNTKLLYTYFEDVFQELELDYKKVNKDFYILKYEERKALIEEKVQQIADKLNTEQAPEKAIPFGNF